MHRLCLPVLSILRRRMGIRQGKSEQVRGWLKTRFEGRPRVEAYYLELWESFAAAELADDHFVVELTSDRPGAFQQRVWEMLLARHLMSCGHDISRRPNGEPDFSFRHAGATVWVEATSPGPGNDLPPDWLMPSAIRPAVGTVPFGEILLRWTTAFDAKWKKSIEYARAGVIRQGDAYVIAIDGGQLTRMSIAHGVSRLPYAVEVTLGVGPVAIQIDAQTGRHLGAVQTARLEVENRNKALVRTEPFLRPEYAGVSALLGCCASTFAEPLLPVQVAHNPLSAVRLPVGVFGTGAEEWAATMVGEDAEGQDWQLSRLRL